MHPKLLGYYEKELNFLRGMGKEFAERYPEAGQKLDLGRFECADPYVERLLEGFAFLAARVQLKLDAEFPDFTQYLLNIVYPHYLSPTPSMAIVRMAADMKGGVTAEGFRLPRGARLFSDPVAGGQSRCEFRTARDVALWPLTVSAAEYLSAADAGYYPSGGRQARSGLRLRLQAAEGVPINTLALDELVFYLDGGRETTGRIYELLAAHTASIVVQPMTSGGKAAWSQTLPASMLQPLGFSDEEALLPYTDASFQGYRLLQEYYAFPERFLFVRLAGLQPAIRRLKEGEGLEIVCLFSDRNELLRGALDAGNFLLHCAPAINLFPRRADRIHVSPQAREHQVIVDRTHAQDYEVYAITGVSGYDVNLQESQQFRAFYDCRNGDKTGNAYYSWRRVPHLPPTNSRTGKDYQGSEVYLSLVDGRGEAYLAGLKQLGVGVLCTNRDAPLYVYQNRGRVGFTLEESAPVTRVESIAGPSRPRPAHAEGERAWRLINHLSLNYLSLLDNERQQGAAALRELLRLYADEGSAGFSKQLEGLLSVSSEPVVRRLPGAGPITFGRGVGITLHCRDSAFDGLGAFLLGSVLEKFFARYVSINSFTQMTLTTVERGEVMRWPVRTGTTPVL
ncbi:type VI secretion system baseplate subunit TssF [Candidatus Thiothrix sp. Deng01]|uniref:Type VI secretion system baseplate subunit TssF n=1 Tax=Candidatus Thiothrix phosphatis TaxID=3112415 RepID=A0ABU6CWS1_9GAMM|nr:type VI secretion system baseplate subunit TssF [Candidatus Thiothrix sp. Deng01]MEB4591271.1 type VI secretion system baseplate subunit TssF [Candidatus Thiothrix sp. Deng01]